MGSGEELVYEIEIKKPFIGSGPSKRVFLIHLLETRAKTQILWDLEII
jgi:fido (protein-threonine AMPylation protein)